MKPLTYLATLILFTATLPLTGCLDTGPSTEAGDTTLKPFASSNELLNYFKSRANNQQRTTSFNSFGFFPLAAPATNAEADDAAGGQSRDGSYSTTNLQEQGVDESDVFKSDGTYFYIARDQSVRIIKANPTDQLAQVAQVNLDARVQSLYLFNNQLITISQLYESTPTGDADAYIWPPYYQSTSTLVTAIDITDPANPTLAGQITLDGTLASSRLTAGKLYLILTIVPDIPTDRGTLAAVSLDDILPTATIDNETTEMVAWQNYLRPTSPDGFYTTAVVTLDAANIQNKLGSVAVMANAGTIYASTNALYITDDTYDENDNFRQYTTVHKLRFDDQAGAVYVGSGSVPGRLLNQFSLSEHDGLLRLATHVNDVTLFRGGPVDIAFAEAPATNTNNAQSITPSQPYNAVWVIKEASGELTTVGSLENIAPGEDLYAARFLGNIGFLVTFETIDPLFTLDLSDATTPRIVGELKIPGYSEYLHPLDNGLLIGVGRAVGQTQWGFDEPRGVQLSLFDVSDLANPSAIQQLEIGGFFSSTDVSTTHKAFTFMPDTNTLAIPAKLTPSSTDWGDYSSPVFDGVLCYQVSSAGFTLLGQLAATTDQTNDYYRWGWYPSDWRRPAFINDTLYALSPDGVNSAPLTDFNTTTSLTLEDPE